MESINENDIAIIGMAGRFPNAANIEAYWKNLQQGLNTFRTATEEMIKASGISEEILNDKRFVNSSSRLEEAKFFDADFFGISNMEATLMDPQIRLLLQTSWHALEDSGYAINNLDATVGNFCGMSTNSYLMKVLKTNAQNELVDPLLYRILSEKDFLATWISYKLNLTGPTFTVQTACSTSLLAIHLACQSLLNMECSMALAGGACFDADENIGYMHVPGSIYAKDGICRPFDSEASGTVMGDGVACIVLKRATEAIEDKDHIYALIKGTACNNDGSNKQGYTTPSVNYQRDMILEALGLADIDPSTIGMIEAHGTGTLIGDPIEVTALTEAFRAYTDQSQFCAIGSVKGNIGHLDAAAGVASTIKAALCVNKGELVPNCNFSKPNPSLNLTKSPFYVSQDNTTWPNQFAIRRAGVSSLGVGGTNVHLLIEQAPQLAEVAESAGPYVISLSAQNENSLHAQKRELHNYLKEHPEIRLEDVEFTSLYGRKVMSDRFSLVCKDKSEALAQLNGDQAENCYEGYGELSEAVFMFPGQGSQYGQMAFDLYQQNEAFRKDMDYCFDYVQSNFGLDIKTIINAEDSTELNKTEHTQISLFIIEYCLAKELWRSGIKPQAVIGHSLGEYVAACLVDCINLEDALTLVYHRGRLMGMMPEGAMALIRCNEEQLKPLLLDAVSVCAYNAPESLVIGGSKVAIEQQCAILEVNDIGFKKLRVSHAYHTSMMQDAMESFKDIVSKVEFKHFTTKLFSTYTGALIGPEQFCSTQYWLDQIMNPVKFQMAIEDLGNYFSNPVFIEVGPGNGLTYFIKKTFAQEVNVVNVLPKASAKAQDLSSFYTAKALLCAKGLVFDLPENHAGKRISLPGYVFTKKYFWKPQKDVIYQEFNMIHNSFHQENKQYLTDRLRTSIEVKLSAQNELTGEVLEELDRLHEKYMDGISVLFADKSENINARVEVLYDDITCLKNQDVQKSSNDLNKKRQVSSIFVEPSTEMEKTIAKHWAEVLGYQPVGILDNYFEVGGNSLLATQLINRLSHELNCELSFKELSEAVTIKELSLLVEAKNEILELVEQIEVENTNDENFIEL